MTMVVDCIFSGNPVVISHNLFLENEVGRSLGYGWGGGVAVLGEETSATLSYNRFSENYAPTAGGGVFIDDGARAILDHELIENNECEERGGAGVYVDGAWDDIGSTGTLRHCTIANNHCPGCTFGGSGLLVEYHSVVTVEDSIFWGNGGDDFHADETSRITITYTDSEETVAGTGNLSSNPLFANPANNDYHLQSTTGRWDPATGGGTGGWVLDLNQSPCIDKGNPQSGFANEPVPNGGRINMGVYGNTQEASKSPVTHDCPVCTDVNVVIENFTYQPGADCECTASSSIIVGPNVMVESGAKVILKAPRVSFKTDVTVKQGADFRTSQ